MSPNIATAIALAMQTCANEVSSVMMHNEYFLNRQMQLALYSLKRQYGGEITVFHVLSRSVDTKTGVPTARYRATRIKRAIILPVKVSRELERNISLISVNKRLVTGGGYDMGRRRFLVDRRDAPALELAKDDFLVYNQCKYALESIEEYEFASAYSLIARKLIGERFDDRVLVQHLGASDSVELVGDADRFRVFTRDGSDVLALTSTGEAEV